MLKIITDSASDISPEEGELLGVAVVPLKIFIDGREYRDGIDITNKQLYARMASSPQLPTTAQPAIEDFEAAFEDTGADEIIAVVMSSKLSGTFQAAKIAASDMENKRIWIVDSETVSLAERLLVMRAVQLRDEGAGAEEIAAILEKEREEIALLAVVDTLEYLKKGGRLSKTEALVGGMLGVKPIVTLEKGELVVLGKKRGLASAYQFVRDTATGMGELDKEKPHALGFTADESVLGRFIEAVGEEIAPSDAIIDSVGGTIGIHVGPGAVAVAYFIK